MSSAWQSSSARSGSAGSQDPALMLRRYGSESWVRARVLLACSPVPALQGPDEIYPVGMQTISPGSSLLKGRLLFATGALMMSAATWPWQQSGRIMTRRASTSATAAVAPDSLAALAAHSSRGIPSRFQALLTESFRAADEIFSPQSHQGKPAEIVKGLKEQCCIALADLSELTDEEQRQAHEWTAEYIKALWRVAKESGLVFTAEGKPMRAPAAPPIARAVLASLPERSHDGDDNPGALGLSQYCQGPARWIEEEISGDDDSPSSIKEESISKEVPEHWREQLLRLDRPDALRLARQLGGDSLLGWLRHGSGKRLGQVPAGLFGAALEWKSQQPHCVLLVQVGDFFEAWGVDAVMLVQWCGLMPMAGRPRAGFPLTAASLQQALERLTSAGLSAAVYVQVAGGNLSGGSRKLQERKLQQVVTPGAPTYLYANELKRFSTEERLEFAEGRPYVAIRWRSYGILYAEIRPFRQEICYRERVPPEGVEALLAAHDGIALPIIVDAPQNFHAGQWPWIPKDRHWLKLLSDTSDQRFLKEAAGFVGNLLQQDVTSYRTICLHGVALNKSTAENLGVLPSPGKPLLENYVVASNSPLRVKNFWRQWMLAPRPCGVALHMRELLSVLLESRVSLPQLRGAPSIASLMARLSSQTAPANLFRSISTMARQVLQVLESADFQALRPPLLALVANEVGQDSISVDDLKSHLHHTLSSIWSRLSKHGDVGAIDRTFEDTQTQDSLEAFFAAHELYRGVAAEDHPEFKEVSEQVRLCREEVKAALLECIEVHARDALIYNPLDRDLCFKERPRKGRSRQAKDRKGNAKKRWTSESLEKACSRYIDRTQWATEVVKKLLADLAAELRPSIPSLCAGVWLAEILTAAHAHASHVVWRGWQMPKLVNALEDAKEERVFDASVWPYFMGDDAIASDVQLDHNGALMTGPNMAGKSTLMRAICSTALLANCGMLAPCVGRVPTYGHLFFLAVHSDAPAEGLSSFGHEAHASASTLRQTNDRSLVLVDEFGRGTDPISGQAAVGAFVEELSSRRAHFIIATHLHSVVDLPFQLPQGQGRPRTLRMGVADREGREVRWTYKSEEGVSRESFADLTLRKFGWSDKMLARYYRLLEVSGSAASRSLRPRELKRMADSSRDADALQPEEEPSTRQVPVGFESFEDKVLEVVCWVTGKDAEDIISMAPLDAPPAMLCTNTAVLYVLLLKSNLVYVGQSDGFYERLQNHRRRFGDDLERVLVLPVTNTAEARQLESYLLRCLERDDVDLVSRHDGRHKSFGTPSQGGYQRYGLGSEEDVNNKDDDGKEEEGGMDEAEDSDRLRAIAAQLLELANNKAK